MDREGLAIVLNLKSQGVSGCNTLGSSNAVGLNVSCCTGSQTVIVGNQGAADATPNFQYALPLLV